jgi:hypothetical protein
MRQSSLSFTWAVEETMGWAQLHQIVTTPDSDTLPLDTKLPPYYLPKYKRVRSVRGEVRYAVGSLANIINPVLGAEDDDEAEEAEQAQEGYRQYTADEIYPIIYRELNRRQGVTSQGACTLSQLYQRIRLLSEMEEDMSWFIPPLPCETESVMREEPNERPITTTNLGKPDKDLTIEDFNLILFG